MNYKDTFLYSKDPYTMIIHSNTLIKTKTKNMTNAAS